MKATIFNIQKFSLHDGPGIRTTVFFKGCNLRCGWCCNPEGLLPDIQLTFDAEKCIGCGECVKACAVGARTVIGGKSAHNAEKCKICGACITACIYGSISSYGTEYTVDELVAELVKDKAFYQNSGGGVTLSGGEFLLQPDFASELCDALHKQNIHVAVETAAAVPTNILRKLMGKIDLWQVDFKHYDNAVHRAATGLGNEQIIENIKEIVKSGYDYLVRIPIVSGFNDTIDDAREFADILTALGVNRTELMPFHQMGERKYALLGMEYTFAHRDGLYKEDLTEYAQVFRDRGIMVL